MGCGSKRRDIKRSRKNSFSKNEENFNFEDLENKGRLKFFFHSPISNLPIRDITGLQKQGNKTEPNIENGAENFINSCYQKNVVYPFLDSNEKYLFFFTTNRNNNQKKYCNQRYIVGYLLKRGFLDIGTHYAVSGDIKLVSFDDAYPLKNLRKSNKNIRVLNLDERITEKLLKHFQDKKNILDKCLKELERLKSMRITNSNSQKFKIKNC